jgi:hypothetical protein
MRRLDWTKWTFGAATLAGLLGVAAWQAGSLKVGAIFLVGLAQPRFVYYAAAIVLDETIAADKNFGSFSVAQAVNSLYRPAIKRGLFC